MTEALIIVTGALALIYIAVISLKKPVIYMWLYLLASTKLLGFVNFSYIEIRGMFNVMFYLNVVTIISIIITMSQERRVDTKDFRFPFAIAALTAFGMLYPVFLGYSGIISSVTDGKDFLCYSFLGYLLIHRKDITTESIYRVITFIGISLSVIMIISSTTGLSPAGYEAVNEELGNKGGIHIYYSTFISLAIFLQLTRFIRQEKSFKDGLMVLILFFGALLQPHRSLFFSILPASAFLIFYKTKTNFKLQMIFCLIAVLFGMRLFLDRNLVTETFIEPINELLQQEGSMASRRVINSFRWDEIANRPLLGYGFIDESSKLGDDFKYVSNTRYNQTLGTVDSGYIDSLIRFGIVGTILLLSLYIYIIVIPFRRGQYKRPEMLAAGLFLGSYFIVSLTWSVFTYIHGIIPACAAVYLILVGQNYETADSEIFADSVPAVN